MRKYIILTILLSCLHIAARGQTIASLDDIDLSGLPKPTAAKQLRYWFDDDGSVKTTTQMKGTQTLDASALTEGLHTVHYQVVDENNNVADVSSALFMKLNSQASATAAKQLRYWFDDDASTLKTITATGGAQTLDASNLMDGLHTVHYQVVGSDNAAYHIVSALFMKMGGGSETVTAKKLMYWFDDETAITTVDVSGGVQMLDASRLMDGLHTLHFQVLCSNGMLTSATSALFMRMNIDAQATTARQLRYWFDDAQTATTTSITAGATTLDAKQLTEGLHTVHYQIVDSRGAVCPPSSALFIKMDAATQATQAQRLRYWFDDDATTLKVIDVAKGTQTLDVSTLLTGLHTLCYQLVDSEGKVSTPYTRLFMKAFDKVVPDGQNRVVKYQYWLNSNSQAMQTVTLNAAANPYTLISLLPMPKEPIHSDCFHFEMTNGKPTVYAKNIFHIRFHDAAGYFADGDRPFIDYSVKQEVTGATPLDRLKTNTISTPGDNQIHWFSFKAELGDTTAFKASQATTIQVFAPDGEEVYSVSGSESVTFGGIHTWQEGTYYVALHDVTGSKPTVSLDFMHLAKYDVVRQDVNVVGNGGISTITFDGNGFKDLYAVTLYNSKGDSIKAEAIGFQNDAVVSLTFDFTDVRVGTYDAVFHFTTEDKTFKNIVTVEEAKDIELALDVKYPSTFLRGTSTTYTITVTNKGNATAYDVPMEIYLSAGDSFANISSVKFKDENGKLFNNFTLDDIEEKDSIDEEFYYYVEGLLNELNGLQSFIIQKNSTDGVEYGFTDQMLTIPPNSSATFYLEIKSSATISLNVIIPSEWITTHSDIDIAEARIKSKRSLGSSLCCHKEKVECTSGIISDIAGLFPGAPGCVTALGDNAIFYGFEFFCADGNSFREKWSNFIKSVKNKSESAVNKGLNALLSCFTFGVGKWIKGMKGDLDKYKRIRGNAWNSMEKYKQQAQSAQEMSEAAWKNFDNAVMSGDMDLAATFKKQAQELMVEASEYNKLADGAYSNWLEYTARASNLEAEIGVPKENLLDWLGKIKNGISAVMSSSDCYKAWTQNNPNCPPNPQKGGGSSNPVTSYDPNDIFGYTAESGSHAIMDGLTDVYYRIEFENDTAFATAPAHDIWLTDTLDASKFDLSTFKPTRIKIGEKTAELTGEQNFVTTVDMRPGINAIAQVEGTYDRQKGIARWHISSLDPMTMEPTKYVQDGVLPVNTDGRGLGEVMYDISLKPGLAHGTEIKNRAGIVFDTNDVIMTPTWTNTIDRVKPESRIVDATLNEGGETAAISIEASDEGSGPWRYDVYVQYGSGAWFLAAENVPADTVATVKLYDGIEHHFYSVARDMAGNVEQKEARSEFTLTVSEREHGDVNGDGAIDVADIADIIDTMARGTYRVHADANNDGAVDVADIAEVISIMAARARAAAAEAEALEE